MMSNFKFIQDMSCSKEGPFIYHAALRGKQWTVRNDRALETVLSELLHADLSFIIAEDMNILIHDDHLLVRPMALV